MCVRQVEGPGNTMMQHSDPPRSPNLSEDINAKITNYKTVGECNSRDLCRKFGITEKVSNHPGGRVRRNGQGGRMGEATPPLSLRGEQELAKHRGEKGIARRENSISEADKREHLGQTEISLVLLGCKKMFLLLLPDCLF